MNFDSEDYYISQLKANNRELSRRLKAAEKCIEEVRYWYERVGHYQECKKALEAYDKVKNDK